MVKMILYPHVPYNKNYPNIFEGEKNRITKVLGNVTIEHFGSTAVPNLGGKGYIDIYVVVDKKDLQETSQKIQEKLGYEYKPSGSDDKERFFFLRKDKIKNNDQIFHLHLTYPDHFDFQQSIKFRDYLRSHPDEVTIYEKIKKLASEKANNENTKEDAKRVYMNTKKDFIERIVKELKTGQP